MERISSRKNPLCLHLKRLAADGGYRRETGLFLCDSPKLAEEALRWAAETVDTVVTTPGRALDGLPPAVRAVEVTEDVMEAVSPSKTPQGVLAVCRMRPAALPKALSGNRYVVLDGVQDPGNLGTIIRTADAMGAAGVLLGEGCADPYAPKPLRAAMGSVYHLDLWQGTLAAELARMKEQGFALVCGHLKGESVLPEPGERCALVIGSEGAGVSDEAAALCDKYRLPMYGFAESLNASVAAGIIIYELARRMHES